MANLRSPINKVLAVRMAHTIEFFQFLEKGLLLNLGQMPFKEETNSALQPTMELLKQSTRFLSSNTLDPNLTLMDLTLEFLLLLPLTTPL